jgi:hypothetical protein
MKTGLELSRTVHTLHCLDLSSGNGKLHEEMMKSIQPIRLSISTLVC